MAHLLHLLAPILNLHGSLREQITSLKLTSPFRVLELELISYILLTILAILLYIFLISMNPINDEIANEEFILEMRFQTLERRMREMRQRGWEERFYARAILGV